MSGKFKLNHSGHHAAVNKEVVFALAHPFHSPVFALLLHSSIPGVKRWSFEENAKFTEVVRISGKLVYVVALQQLSDALPAFT